MKLRTKVALFLFVICIVSYAQNGNFKFDQATDRLIYKANSLLLQGSELYKNKSYKEAIRCSLKAINIIGQIKNEYPILSGQYIELLNSLTVLYLADERFEEAKDNALLAVIEAEKVRKEKNLLYAQTLNNLSQCLAYCCDYNEAIKIAEKAADITEKLYLCNPCDTVKKLYSTFMMNSSICYWYYGDEVSAIRTGKDAVELCRRIHGDKSRVYAKSLNNLATFYEGLGNYNDAFEYYCEAYHIQECSNFEWDECVHILQNMAVCKFYLKSYDESVMYSKKAMSLFKNLHLEVNDSYANILSNLGICYLASNKPDSAMKCCEQAIQFLDKLDPNAKKKSSYSLAYKSLGTVYLHMNLYDKAKDAILKGIKIDEDIYRYSHTQDINSMLVLSFCYFKLEDINKMDYYMKDALQMCLTRVKKVFAGLTAKERGVFWSAYHRILDSEMHILSFNKSTENSIACCYNGTLISKGLLLNSEIEFSKLIQESGDEGALKSFNKLRTLRKRITKLQERSQLADSLSNEADELEQKLMKTSETYGNYTENLVITWEQVQEKLGTKDIAVEFVSFPLNADSTMYIAYVLKKDWECPRMIKLFEERELKAVIGGKMTYRTDTISRLVWKPLDDVMQGVENVYFAPSGELYNVAIESVPTHEDGGKTLISEHGRNYYRLSSTRELALRKDKGGWHEAVVYGGLKYNMSVDDMIKDDREIKTRDGVVRGESTPSYYVVRGDGSSRNVDPDYIEEEVDTLEYLGGTLEEAKAITKSLEERSISTQQITGTNGTETSFKDLHGRKKSIIHIGTHGFFNNRGKEYKRDELQLLGTNMQAMAVEDDALTCSGLYFAGADNVRKNGITAIPDSIDDGILKASEIAQLDLRGLDLVVLSACQTGLGEITGDGVFGLQRGFKKAGAQTIVMSLWSVHDLATQDFMTTFFANIEIDDDGHPTNKHEAFKIAQDTLWVNRNKYKEKEAQDCWAAFVMLDGVE